MADSDAEYFRIRSTFAETRAKELGAETDGLNASILAVEDALRKLHTGVPARVTIEVGNPPAPKFLAFAKDGKTWKLLVITVGEDGLEDWTPLSHANRDIRVRSINLFADLLNAMILATETEITRVSDAKQRAAEFAAQITIALKDFEAKKT